MSHSPAGPRHLQHHFEDTGQQFDSALLGTWLFLVTELMFFGGLFMCYILYRSWYPEIFEHASHHLDIKLGALNTAILLGSSYTVVMSVDAAQQGNNRSLISYLVATIGLGTAFLCVKAFEYWEKYIHGLIPGPLFTYDGPDAAQQELFFSVYFAMTGVHALHMVIGVGLFIWLVLSAQRRRYNSEYFTPVECVGLYWHFVDLIWIFLFPLLYLLGRT